MTSQPHNRCALQFCRLLVRVPPADGPTSPTILLGLFRSRRHNVDDEWARARVKLGLSPSRFCYDEAVFMRGKFTGLRCRCFLVVTQTPAAGTASSQKLSSVTDRPTPIWHRQLHGGSAALSPRRREPRRGGDPANHINVDRQALVRSRHNL